MSKLSKFAIVIMAGGSGTRLWPKSRLSKPKQLYALINNDSMIKNTVNRVTPIVGKKNIYIATNIMQAKTIAKELPDLKNNLIIEPQIRNTGPCIGLSALKLANKAQTVAFLPSDAYIADEKMFLKTLKQAFEIAMDNLLVLIGIRPTDPDTGLGYIQINDKLQMTNYKEENSYYKVKKFIEKPDLKTAKNYLKSSNYFWNAGMFVASPKLLLSLFEKHAPKIFLHLQNIDKNPKLLDKEYELMENISFDYAVSEKTDKLAVIPGEFGWSDIGNWSKLLDMLSKKNDDNVVVGCEHLGVDTSGCLIHGTERLVATIGLKDIIVVDTPDAVLVCHKTKAQEVKKIVEGLKNKNREKYL